MARFKWKGEIPSPGVIQYGPTLRIKIPKKDGTAMVLEAPDADGFPIGQDIGMDILDDRSIIVLRADPRFEEIL